MKLIQVMIWMKVLIKPNSNQDRLIELYKSHRINKLANIDNQIEELIDRQMEQQQPYNNTTPTNKPQQHIIDEAFTFSQFINTIKITTSQQDFKLLKPLSSLSNTSQEFKSLTPYHFRQLVIQFFYLLYSCHHLKIVPVPEDDKKFICYSYEGGNVCLCLNEFVYFEDSAIKDYQTMVPYFFYYKNFITAIHTFWKSSQQQAQKQSKRQHLTADYFMNKLNQLLSSSSSTSQNKQQHQQLTSQKQAFSKFQKQQIFIQTSILLRINRSALVCVIRRSQQLMELYTKHRKIEQQLSQEYNERRKRKNNIQKVLQTEKNIEKNIQEFFLSLKKNPFYYKVEDKRRKEANSMSYGGSKLLMGIKVYEQALAPAQNTNTNMSTQSNPAYDPDYYNSYEIQYQSMKNIIIVRMVTDLVLDWATSDSILFKWNTLTFQTSNVGLETIQKTDEQNKVKKFIVIRGTSYFNKKQPVIEKMLTLVDITMATYKSIQLQMKSETFFNKNINKINESYQKINHYLKSMHKCCQKTYSAMMVNQQQDDL